MTTRAHISHRNQTAAVGYIPLLNFLIFWAHRHERFVVEHAINGILLTFYFLGAYFLIPDFGIYIALLFVAGVAVGFIHASSGREFRLPLIADFVDWLADFFDKK
ncbi:MAG: hypothetical protein K9L85_02740 [Candidatus Peribacteraceae bacterium]|nr:hypothetical protein [Candidatus Peribacteraceae bacterium]